MASPNVQPNTDILARYIEFSKDYRKAAGMLSKRIMYLSTLDPTYLKKEDTDQIHEISKDLLSLCIDPKSTYTKILTNISNAANEFEKARKIHNRLYLHVIKLKVPTAFDPQKHLESNDKLVALRHLIQNLNHRAYNLIATIQYSNILADYYTFSEDYHKAAGMLSERIMYLSTLDPNYLKKEDTDQIHKISKDLLSLSAECIDPKSTYTKIKSNITDAATALGVVKQIEERFRAHIQTLAVPANFDLQKHFQSCQSLTILESSIHELIKKGTTLLRKIPQQP